jgi:hypothetical protein
MRWLSLSEHLASPVSVSLLIDCLLQRCRWLGQNSKQTKLGRQLGDIQIRMRLKVSGSRNEIRQEYMPALAYKIVLPLTKADAMVSFFWLMDRR